MTVPGEQFKVTVGFDRIDEAVSLNLAAGEHLWVIPVVYGLTSEEAAVAEEGVTILLDRGHLLAVAGVGCYICEEPYSDVAGRKCAGLA